MTIDHSSLGRARSALLTCAVGAVSSLTFAADSQEDPNSIKTFSDFLAQGTASGQVGVGANYRINDNASDPGLSWGYVQASYITPDWNGFTAGGGFLGVGEIWENHSGDFSSVFQEPFDVQQLFLEYQNEPKTIGAALGRKSMAVNPGQDGDYQQGVNFQASTPEGFSLTLTAINRWIKYSTYNYDTHGITGWEDVSDVYPEAGEVYFSATADIPIGSQVSLSPYFNYQENVMAFYGATFDSSIPVNSIAEGSLWETSLILSIYDNQVSASIQPEYEDAWGGLFETGLDLGNYGLAIGTYWISDDTIDTGAGAFNIFDPLKEDDLYPFNDQNDFQLYYAKGRVVLGDLTLYPAIGIGRNYALESDSLELDLLFEYQLPGNFELEGYLVYVDFERDVLPNFLVGGFTLGYGF